MPNRITDLKRLLPTGWTFARTARVAKRGLRGESVIGLRTRAALAAASETVACAIIDALIKTSQNSRLALSTLSQLLHDDPTMAALFQLNYIGPTNISFVGDTTDARAPTAKEIRKEREQRLWTFKAYRRVLRPAAAPKSVIADTQ